MLIGKPKRQAGIRTGNVTEELKKDFLHNVISDNLKQDPKRFSPM